jgi:hypothetical protein
VRLKQNNLTHHEFILTPIPTGVLFVADTTKAGFQLIRIEKTLVEPIYLRHSNMSSPFSGGECVERTSAGESCGKIQGCRKAPREGTPMIRQDL